MRGRQPLHLSAPWRLLPLAVAWAIAACASPDALPPLEAPAVVGKRQECRPNFYSCANQGVAFNGICCQNGQICSLDANNNPACCPSGAVCTGTVPASFVTPCPATTTTTAVSYVPNAYFPFPYIATSFANPGFCSAAVGLCSANYAACTAQLEGQGASGGYAVTIVVPGGGGITVTARGGASYNAATATSICSSLSSVACSGLQSSMCTMSGTTAKGFYFGTETGNVAARPTGGAIAALAGAVAAGAAGFGAL